MRRGRGRPLRVLPVIRHVRSCHQGACQRLFQLRCHHHTGRDRCCADDHVKKHPVITDSPFEGQTTEQYRVDCRTGDGYTIGTAGDFGDYEDFTGDIDQDTQESNYTLNEHYINGQPTTTITFTGSDYVGHKFYDTDGNLLWATNYRQADLPENIRALGTANYRIVTARVVNLKPVIATADNPIDKTALITNPTFDNNNKDGWTVECQKNGGSEGSGVAEFWNSSTFDMSQTLTTLQAGRWCLEMDGLMRAGNSGTEKATIDAGLTPLNELYLYARVGSKTNEVKVCQWSDTERGAVLITDALATQVYANANDTYTLNSAYAPQTRDGFIKFYTAGRYHNSLYFDVPTGGSDVTIGLQLRETCSYNWCPFDNFRLTYLGLPGDVTQDGTLDTDDLTLLIDIILGKADSTGIEKTADVNGDGKISIADITALLNAL